LTSFFAERFPERFFNIGIAEPCMVDVAVGMALGGKIPFANGFAALLSGTDPHLHVLRAH
jgi:transketolase